MTHSKHISLLFIGFFLLITQSCTVYEEVEMLGVKDYNIGDINTDYVDVAITVKINNPNKYNIRIKRSTLDLFVEKEKVGKAKMKEDIVLKKQTEGNYTFVVQANYKELSSAVFSSLKSALFKSTIKLGVKGKVKAKAFGVVGKKFDLDIQEDIKVKELMGMIR